MCRKAFPAGLPFRTLGSALTMSRFSEVLALALTL
jgi:hypothetical protein